MATLHTLNKLTGSSGDILSRCLSVITPDDMLLLQENGVFVMVSDSCASKRVLDVICAKQVFCLAEDAIARGISTSLTKGVQLITYAQYVALTEKSTMIISWY